MYEITITNGETTEKLHEMVSGSNRKVAAGTFTDGVNIVPNAQAVIYPQNPAYSHIYPMTTRVKYTNTKTGNVEFEGRVLKVPFEGMDSDGVVKKQITFEGLLSYLYDTVQEYAFYAQITTSALLQALITVHNAQFPAGSDQIIDPATCVVTDITEQMSDVEVGYAQTFSEIKRLLLDVYGGELYMKRNAQGKLVLYWMAESDYIAPSDTTIELAKNIKALSVDTDATHIITRLFPYGAKINDTNQRLTIQHADVGGQEWGQTYIDDVNAIAQYGVICGVVTNDDIEDATALYQNAVKYMQNNNRVRKSYKAQVLDLSTIGLEPEALESGNVYRFKNSLIGLDEELRLIKKTVDIYKPYMPTVEIGDKTEKITSAAARAINFIQYEYPKQQAGFLEAAKNTAASQIMNATHGYIVFNDKDGDGYPDEFLVMNNPDPDVASEIWRWNTAGLMYTTDYNDATKYTGPAITKDGAISADFITVGTLRSMQIVNGLNGEFVVDKTGFMKTSGSGGAVKVGSGTVTVAGYTYTGGYIEFDNAQGNAILFLFGNGNVYAWTGNNWVSGNGLIQLLGKGVVNFQTVNSDSIIITSPVGGGTFQDVSATLYALDQRVTALENA